MMDLLGKAHRGELIFCANPSCPGYVLPHILCSGKRRSKPEKEHPMANEKKKTPRRRMSPAEKALGPIIAILRPLTPEDRKRVVATAMTFLADPGATS